MTLPVEIFHDGTRTRVRVGESTTTLPKGGVVDLSSAEGNTLAVRDHTGAPLRRYAVHTDGQGVTRLVP